MADVEYVNIAKKYGAVEVMRGLSLRIEHGEFAVLLGPSGCGKTTLLRMTAGLETITEGELRIGGARMNETHPRDRDIAMVFQNYALYPTMKVWENIGFSLEVKKLPKKDVRARVEEAAEMLNLTPYLDRYPRELSGGQRQRVAMGRAMVRDAKVFLFDEPLSNLDAKLRAQMRVEIRQLHDRLGATTVYVTHDQIEAMTMADKIVLMNAGRIEQIGSPDEVYDRPMSRYVADFIGTPGMNFIEGAFESGSGGLAFVAAGIRLPLPAGAPVAPRGGVVCGLRPADLKLDPAGGIHGALSLTEKTGADEHLHVSVQGRDLVAVAPRHALDRAARSVTLSIAPDKAHYFDAGDGARLF
ncbi:ABC transporter ATP-binding protein [Rubrimonas cliftonensis]|uniref:Carbohydrate ABC transporter ATP-binding protein, CUT1 family n=1 Tax=Rubrimonas cliftonensis TaxID=89524 RepID=A0A1H4DJU7_9RHOB|nr:sn-glycerol-3-phosphate ABC transporter ATP-binding protein UgpC [Rubrimonas cliftonensis]SEA72492.1 carbohydrate ABC transporter ATP-binding protein, CUT1 family [Rubrimonas cliftonensis]